MKRHYDEREQLLKYLQDESITELMEAASEMSADERKSRLAELQTKRRKLDLANSGETNCKKVTKCMKKQQKGHYTFPLSICTSQN